MEFTAKLVTKAILLNSSFAQLYLWIANPNMICDLRDMTAFLCFHSRWWGWENWLSRLRTANSALSARRPSSLRRSSHWRRTTTLASCKLPKISLKGKGGVPLSKKKKLTFRQMGCHSCCIVLSHQTCGQRQRGRWHIPPKCYFVLYWIGKNLTVVLNLNIPLRRGAVKKGCKLRITTRTACKSERVRMVAKQMSDVKHT